MIHQELLQEFRSFARTAPSCDALMQAMAKRLHETMSRYNWVGFYLIDSKDPGVLVIGPYVGSFTPNVRIPLNKGLCGAAATSRQTVVLDDVSKDERYLPGSSMVKSEIVVPILAGKSLAGELDIESYFPATFTKAEQEFVEACAGVVGLFLQSSAPRPSL
jgi:L-methionine (R)-S-oxide reductase